MRREAFEKAGNYDDRSCPRATPRTMSGCCGSAGSGRSALSGSHCQHQEGRPVLVPRAGRGRRRGAGIRAAHAPRDPGVTAWARPHPRSDRLARANLGQRREALTWIARSASRWPLAPQSGLALVQVIARVDPAAAALGTDGRSWPVLSLSATSAIVCRTAWTHDDEPTYCRLWPL